MSRLIIEEEYSHEDKLYLIKNNNKCLFDSIICDSEVERKFAQESDIAEKVKLFTKLPRWFRVDTPVGSYNPDWALILEDNKFYIKETKGSYGDLELRRLEKIKIECGKQHFSTIGVAYEVTTKL